MLLNDTHGYAAVSFPHNMSPYKFTSDVKPKICHRHHDVLHVTGTLQ